jgi:hypothetical protein
MTVVRQTFNAPARQRQTPLPSRCAARLSQVRFVSGFEQCEPLADIRSLLRSAVRA